VKCELCHKREAKTTLRDGQLKCCWPCHGIVYAYFGWLARQELQEAEPK